MSNTAWDTYQDADHPPVISPEVFNRSRCTQIIDRLQNHVRPDLFHRKAIYDGRKILYAAGSPLHLVDSAGQSVSPLSY